MQTINANNPFLSYKFATQIALGCKGAGRPVFKSRGIDSITMMDDIQDYTVDFGELNYSYVEELPTHDISVYTSEDYGKFFYEYGRTLLANLMICLTKADWNSVSVDSNGVAPYLGNYYNQLINLDDKLLDVISNFKKEAIDEVSYLPFNMQYLKASKLIQECKENIAKSKVSDDMCNTVIFYCAYIGLMYTLYGIFILCSQISEKDVDLFSFMKNPKSNSSLSICERILREAFLGNEEKKHIISLIYVFYRMTQFYNRTSGLKNMDSLIGTMYDISETFVSKLFASNSETAEQIRNLIDPDFTDTSFASGISIESFTDKCDPLLDIMYFRTANIINKDNPNIFAFGLTYLRSYEMESETEDKKLSSKEFVLPGIKTYLESCMKSQYSNEDVERAFGEVRNLVTGVENTDQFSKVESGFILQLVIMASAFRILNARSTQRNKKAHNEINGAIDILDLIILKLYHTWFNSGKFYIQPNRPNYCMGKEGALSTLKLLQHEVDDVLKFYIEFVRYGIGSIIESDTAMYEHYKYEQILFMTEDKNLDRFNRHYPMIDKDTFVKLCATKNGKTISQCAFYGKDTFSEIIKQYERKEMPKSVISRLSASIEKYTGNEYIDKAIDMAYDVKTDSESNPEVYAIAIYATVYFVLDTVFRTYNIGNFFDFGNAENSLGSYNIERIIAKSIGEPLKHAMDFSKI